MHCALDDAIPFCEYFLIPYLFWFVYLIGTLAYTLFCDRDGFRRMMYFVIFTYSITILIYLLFPTCQHLRPSVFDRDNVFTRFVAYFYQFDTDTNVCPSLHVIGSFAACFALWNTERFSLKGWRAVNVLCCVLICVSTVFMKQHSVLDVAAALPLCFGGYALCYLTNPPRRKNHLICKGERLSNMKTINVRGVILGEGRTKIICPVVDTALDAALATVERAKRLHVDAIEYRAD